CWQPDPGRLSERVTTRGVLGRSGIGERLSVAVMIEHGLGKLTLVGSPSVLRPEESSAAQNRRKTQCGQPGRQPYLGRLSERVTTGGVLGRSGIGEGLSVAVMIEHFDRAVAID